MDDDAITIVDTYCDFNFNNYLLPRNIANSLFLSFNYTYFLFNSFYKYCNYFSNYYFIFYI